eukprot:CAMPEP_0202873434 /NCGR_PEP_ID=MMETSP1391-20130828/23261_1 /ASSEMBLY_ACC=CAM_ASM_000867 /TAXON_ID=1034604 /ORGANISM="Chlamydomonas leiostraca, Strain SAG 11-49" /LENGTH=163 /DNA_ID=CAMNT_0049554655 /DNA_START=99 /DNA_END=589 /DNA_ORIENTATION=-
MTAQGSTFSSPNLTSSSTVVKRAEVCAAAHQCCRPAVSPAFTPCSHAPDVTTTSCFPGKAASIGCLQQPEQRGYPCACAPGTSAHYGTRHVHTTPRHHRGQHSGHHIARSMQHASIGTLVPAHCAYSIPHCTPDLAASAPSQEPPVASYSYNPQHGPMQARHA